MRFKNRHAWIEYWDSDIIMTEKINRDAYIECPWIPFSLLNNHLTCMCMNRPVSVATEIEENLFTSATTLQPAHADMSDAIILKEENHQIKSKGQTVSYRDAQNLALKRVELDNFLYKQSADVNCPHCGSFVNAELLEFHVKSECKKLYQRCTLGCGSKILVPEMSDHTENYCPKREINCLLCNQPVWAEEMDEHTNRFCLERFEQCPNLCAKPEIKFRELEHHMIYYCINRQITCFCGEAMIFKEHADHTIADCPKKLGTFN